MVQTAQPSPDSRRSARVSRCAAALIFGVLVSIPARGQQPEGGNELPVAVRTIFETRCLSCHDDRELSGGLSLASATALSRGGESGPAIDLGNPDASHLLQQVTGESPNMPQIGEPLSAEEVAALRDWIRAGAPWPGELQLAARLAYDFGWWSLQPLTRPPLPDGDPGELGPLPENPIDRFIRRELHARGLVAAPPADKRTLIRRLYLDLIGLPPTPTEIDRFVADDDPEAYPQMVDRLLASPRYGERWARHWLDVVHYADSHGFDKDKPRENAWPYRDYVIRAFNQDLPWSEFILQQLAGDALDATAPGHLEALGFLAAGPWDFIGHEELPETKIDGQIARHLDRDDMVRTAVQSFCSLTIGCAQCHDHKFDPISQRDYYQLQAVFAAVDRTEVEYDRDPQRNRQRRLLLAQRQQQQDILDELAAAVRERGGESFRQLEERRARFEAATGLNPTAAFGYHSKLSDSADAEKWVQLDLGDVRSIRRLVVRPAYDDFNQIGAGFGFPVRFAVEIGTDAEFRAATIVADHLSTDFPRPGIEPLVVELNDVAARYVRVRAVRLAARLPTDFNFALAEIEIHDPQGENIARRATISSADSIEAPPRWQRTNLIDGEFPTDARAERVDIEAELIAQRRSLLSRKEQAAWEQAEQQIAAVADSLQALPPPDRVYIAAVHHGSGNFVGTGGRGGQPRAIHRLERGNVTMPREEVGPGALSLLADLPGRLPLAAEHRESDRRLALARWIASPQNHLTWRSVVNRVWQYHFGAGLVDSPDDFGRMGARPSHPELLDWLASEFRDQGQSLKRLHRAIVTSATYRQTSQVDPRDPRFAAAIETDADNRLLWRMNRRRLEAEALRDSILAVSGQLDLRMGGPGFRDFVIERPEHSPHYRYDLVDPDAAELKRRSIYRFVVRSQLQPWMNSLDCADPSIQIGKRNESTTPLQSLVLLNDGFVLAMSKHFADRIAADSDKVADRVRFAFREGLGREPSGAELETLVPYTQQNGLENLARLLFNLNEFAFID